LFSRVAIRYLSIRFLSHAVTDRCRRTLAREIVVDESSPVATRDIGKKMEGKKMEFAAKAIRAKYSGSAIHRINNSFHFDAMVERGKGQEGFHQQLRHPFCFFFFFFLSFFQVFTPVSIRLRLSGQLALQVRDFLPSLFFQTSIRYCVRGPRRGGCIYPSPKATIRPGPAGKRLHPPRFSLEGLEFPLAS